MEMMKNLKKHTPGVVNWSIQFLNDLNIDEAKQKIIKEVENKKIGNSKTLFRLKDWGVSRQRYWGCPIQWFILKTGLVPVEKRTSNWITWRYWLKFKRQSFRQSPYLKQTVQLSTGKKAVRETDTLDTFVDSSWYFLRFCSPDHKLSPFDEKSQFWMPVDTLEVLNMQYCICCILDFYKRN